MPATISAASSTSITGTIGQPVAEAPAVVIRDQRGDPMFGVAVTFAVETGGGTITGATVFSDAQGMAAVGSWTLGTTAGTQTLVANAGPLGPVTFTATAQPGQAVTLSKTAGDDQTAAVGTPVPVAPAVTALDQFGNPVPGVPVSFTVASGGGSVTVGAAVTSAQGTVSVGNWTLGTTPGPNTLTAAADTMSVTFTATATAGAAANMVVHAGAGQTATVATPVPVAPAVRITDGFDNPVPGAAVTFAVTAGGGSVTGAAAVTDADGVATVGSWTLGTTVGANTLTATAGALSVDFHATGTTGPATSIVKQAGDEQEAIVGTAVAVNPSVRVTDAHGNAVAGATVTFAVESGGGSVTGASQTTDANGVATVGSWTLGMVSGANSLSATSGELSTTFTATGLPAPPADITKQAGDAQFATVATAVATAPVVRVTDLHGNPVEGAVVTFAVTGGGGSVAGASQSTDADGVATVGSWTLGTTAGANSLSASVNGLSTVFSATGTADAPTAITKHGGDGQSATVGTSVADDPAVLVTDQHGNPVAGVDVTFVVASGGGSVLGGTQNTDASGVATVGSWTLGNATGTNTLTATAGAFSTTFTATGTAGAPANIVKIDGDNQSATVGSAVLIDPSVHVTDAFGNDVPGASVTFAASGDGSVTGPIQITDAAGVATVGGWTLGTLAGANSLTATANGVFVTFNANGTPGPAALIVKVAGDAQSTEVNTAVPEAPSVQVTDEFGNPVEDVDVAFTVSSGGGSVTEGNQSTDASGVATVGSWTLGTAAGENTLTATAGDLEAIFTATGTAGPPANMVKHAGDGQSATVNTAVAIDPAVRITDEFGNPVAGVAVTFAVASGGGSATGLNQVTDAGGVATVESWTLGTTAGANTLTATAGVLSPVTFDATGTAGPADILGRFVGHMQSAPAGSEVATPPAVRLTDVHGNPVSGVVVTFTVTGGGGSITGAEQVTDANGVAAVGSWTLGGVPGPNELTAAAAGLTATFTATGMP